MEKKNQVLMTVLGVFALVIVTVGVSYAFFTYSRTSTTNNTINTTTQPISFGFTESGQIALTDAVALPAEKGKALANNVYTININASMPTNSKVTYQIYAVNNTAPAEGKEALENSQVRAYLTKGDTAIWTTTDENNANNNGTKLMDEIITSGTEGLLYEYTVDTAAHTEINDVFKLRIWLDKDATGNVIDAQDKTQQGTIDPSTDGSYTTDGETVTSTATNKTYSLQIRVDATAVANQAETVQP